MWTAVIAGGAGVSPPLPRCAALAAGMNNPHGCCIWDSHVLVADAYNHRLLLVEDAVDRHQPPSHAAAAPDLSPRSSAAAKRASVAHAVAARRLQPDATASSSVLTTVAPAWRSRSYPQLANLSLALIRRLE